MTPSIIVIGTPLFLPDIETGAGQVGLDVKQISEQAGYVPALVAEQAAIIFVDGTLSNWDFWCTTPKASPATRRIPVVLVTAHPEISERARQSGADIVISPDALPSKIDRLLQVDARIVSEETAAALHQQCAEPLPDQARQAIEQFNQRQFYKQHDLLEAQWMEEDRPVRDLYRAILQVGVAYYQVERGNKRGAIKMLLRSMQWLNMLPDVCQGVNIAALKADALHILDALEATTSNDLTTFDMTLLKPVQAEPSQL